MFSLRKWILLASSYQKISGYYSLRQPTNCTNSVSHVYAFNNVPGIKDSPERIVDSRNYIGVPVDHFKCGQIICKASMQWIPVKSFHSQSALFTNRVKWHRISDTSFPSDVLVFGPSQVETQSISRARTHHVTERVQSSSCGMIHTLALCWPPHSGYNFCCSAKPFDDWKFRFKKLSRIYWLGALFRLTCTSSLRHVPPLCTWNSTKIAVCSGRIYICPPTAAFRNDKWNGSVLRVLEMVGTCFPIPCLRLSESLCAAWARSNEDWRWWIDQVAL